MSDAPDPRTDAAFAGLVLLLREIAHGLLREGRAAEGRGLIDGIAALRAKTKGNLLEEEERFLSDVVYDLQMAAVKVADARAGGRSGDTGASGAPDASGEPGAPESP